MKCVVYNRVSTQKQNSTDSFSLKVQESICNDYAQSNKLNIIAQSVIKVQWILLLNSKNRIQVSSISEEQQHPQIKHQKKNFKH